VRITGAPLAISILARWPSGIIAPIMVGTSTSLAICCGSLRSSGGLRCALLCALGILIGSCLYDAASDEFEYLEVLKCARLWQLMTMCMLLPSVWRLLSGKAWTVFCRHSPGNPAAVATLMAGLRSLPGHVFWPDDVSLHDTHIDDQAQLKSSGQLTDSVQFQSPVIFSPSEFDWF